jgi:hypothetical protein
MATTVEILAMSTGLPRLDLATSRLGTAEQARSEVQQLFPGRVGSDLAIGDAQSGCAAAVGRLYAGTYGDTTVICGQDLIEIVDLGPAVRAMGHGRIAFRIQLNSVLDAAALDISDSAGGLVREVMLTTDEGVVFDAGPRLDFEQVFWSGGRDAAGAHPATFGDEMPFSPMEFGQEAARALFGFGLAGSTAPGDLDPAAIALYGFEIGAAPAVDGPGVGLAESTLPHDSAVPAIPAESPARSGDSATSLHDSWWRRVWRALRGG